MALIHQSQKDGWLSCPNDQFIHRWVIHPRATLNIAILQRLNLVKISLNYIYASSKSTVKHVTNYAYCTDRSSSCEKVNKKPHYAVHCVQALSISCKYSITLCKARPVLQYQTLKASPEMPFK